MMEYGVKQKIVQNWKKKGKECENSLPELLQVEDRFSVTTSNMYSKWHVGA